MTPFHDMAFIIKDNANNEKLPSSCPFPALMTPFPVIEFINEEAAGCINEEVNGVINEAAIDAIIAGRNPVFYFMFYCFTSTIN